jgi:hypothetical protein
MATMDGRVDVVSQPEGERVVAPEALWRRQLIDRLARMGAGALAVAMGGGGVVDVLAHASPAAASPAGGAHEQRRTHRHAAPRCQPVQGIGAQVHVAAPPVAARPGALDEPHTFEHVEVVRQQVGLHAEPPAQLDRRPVRHRQLVHNGETGRIPQLGVPCRSSCLR